ncbi:hypothetical protein KSF_007560 [Reticulibacter mediterranei]|uniref:Uncharacterized protein n=1 Tax=Reticulibacter mediterranei TaxID=2778369 RepID=A0A8J3IBU4_9CHLR|nr:DUF4419 domain-containing protein [Reticulibacter mediterranei]GHO90708.1 hypothetical protein KSF_007560 [Reticulibacter mediterranei]
MRTIVVPEVAALQQTMDSISNEPFIVNTISKTNGTNVKLRYLSRTQLTYSEKGAQSARSEQTPPPFSQLILTVHKAFSLHLPLSLSPELLWYVICYEVAIHIKENPAAYAHQFGANPQEKTTIEVRDDELCPDMDNNDWGQTLQRFNYALRQTLPSSTHRLFLPPFSTLTPEGEAVLLVSLMDQASAYYRYSVISLCGIPSVRLEGEAHDWEMLYKQAQALSQVFTGLRTYFQDLLPVLSNLRQATQGEAVPEEQFFWKSLYKLNNKSGGPYITGWITAFFAHTATKNGFARKEQCNWRALYDRPMGGFNMNQFPSHLSLVPFQWHYLERRFSMGFIAGILGSEYSDGFLVPQLGYGVAELG